MNVIGVCLFLTASLVTMTQEVLSTPVTFVKDVNSDTVRGRIRSDHDHAHFRNRRESVSAAAQTGNADVAEAVPALTGQTILSRLRRQVAQMAAVSRNYRTHSRRTSSGRLASRRRYHRERAGRSNRVHNW